MKIAIVSPWFIAPDAVGGTERFVQDLSSTLSKIGHEVDVYMLSGKSYQNNNVRYISFSLFGENIIADEYMLTKKFGELTTPDAFRRIANELEQKANFEDYDFLQINSHLFLKCWRDKKRIFTLHANHEEFTILNGEPEYNVMVSTMKEEAKNRSTYFVAPSLFYYDYWHELLGNCAFYIPHGLNTERLKCNRDRRSVMEQYGLGHGLINILLPSRLEMIQKRPNLILEALSRIDSKKRKTYQILFTGLDEQYRENLNILQRIANKNEIKAKFIQFNSISEGYKIADAVLIPSKSESFGYAALESLFLGIPTILSDIPTFREISLGVENVILLRRGCLDLVKILNSEVIVADKQRRTPPQEWVQKYDLSLFAERYIDIVRDKLKPYNNPHSSTLWRSNQ